MIKQLTFGYSILIVLLYINQASSNNSIFKIVFYLYLISYIISSIYSGLKLEKLNSEENLLIQPTDKSTDNVQLKYFEEINNKLDDVILNQKPYLDSKLTIYQLAKILDTNDKYLSMYINVKLNSNFSSYINSLRIEEAKKMLNSEESRNYTFETIGNMAGFHSKSSFNSSFKKSTGMTPSEYLKSISKK
jgi:YesN/AraC family two-component response regulator